MIPLGPLRGRVAVACDRLGRATTLAAAASLTAEACLPDLYGASVSAAIVAAGYGAVWLATLPKGRICDEPAAGEGRPVPG
jgi:hypothetical protein